MKAWEIATGTERRSFDGFEGDSFAAAFGPDGRTLASGHGGQQLLVWDYSGTASTAEPKEAAEIPKLWADLRATDGEVVHRAIWALVAHPADAIAHLRTTLKPIPAVDKERLSQCVLDLDNMNFRLREKATADLLGFGDLSESLLEKFIADLPSLEAQRRAEKILNQIAVDRVSPGRMQQHRAIETLEHIGTPEARDQLEALSRGAAESRVTRDARSSLDRLRRRPNH
jgi:hypothetical protein